MANPSNWCRRRESGWSSRERPTTTRTGHGCTTSCERTPVVTAWALQSQPHELLTDGSLWINGLGGTQVGCRPPLRDQEEWLKTFLTSKPSWRLNGDELILASGGTTITLLDRKIAEPDFPLEGIRWTVVTTITNADLRQGYGRTEQAWISFDRGRLTGWTGCNELSGSFTRNNTELTFSDVATTDRACTAETAATQAAILATLGPAVTYTIDYNQLTLLAPTGIGLDLTAV